MLATYRFSLALALFQVCSSLAATKLPDCEDSEYHYELTECGSDGGRWHVAVPHNPNHCSVINRASIRQKNCDSSCPPGQYLDVSTLKEECKPCASGMYSLGGAVRYSNWTLLPPEFDTYSISDYDEQTQNANETRCNSTWIADGKYLRTKGTTCITRLTLSTTIVRDTGSLSFTYFYTDQFNSIYFQVYARNEQCQISRKDSDGNEENTDDDQGEGVDIGIGDDDNNDNDPSWNGYLESTRGWTNHTMTLKRGKTLIVWEVDHWNPQGSTFSNTVFIKDIEVKGVSFSSECAPCSAGYYAEKEGSSWCQPCPENHISKAGSSKCSACNEVTEYASRGSSECLKRAPCKTTDYIETSTSCEKDNTYQTIYKWIEPQKCSDAIDGAVKLPPPGPKMPCPPCNPGMYLNGTQCLFCPPETFSNGKDPCQKCSASTAPVLGHNFRYWRSLPPNMNCWCHATSENSCSTHKGWLLRGDYLDSGLGHADDATLYLEIKVKGFSGEGGLVSRKASSLGLVRIDFELDCDGPCVFTMYEGNFHEGMEKITDWHGRQARQNYSYAVTSEYTQRFLWRFKKTKHQVYHHTNEQKFDYIKDRVKIYSVVLTNTLDGGADRCRECPIGLHEWGCIDCPEGHYVDKATKKCKACGEGTHLSNGTCVKCGPGLTSKKGSSKCYSSCHYHYKDGRHLSFTKLSGVHSAQTKKSFLTEGTPFIYEYRINLCGLDETEARCHTNVSFGRRPQTKHYLNASICQMRIIPGKNDGPAFATNIAGIGDQLMGIYEEKPANISLDVFKDEKLMNESLLYFEFLSHTTTTSCPNGRSTLIILRCDFDAQGEGTIKFPPECHEGTCDGCQFLLLWHTMHTCPLCTENDYNKIESGCVNRKKTIHYQWNNTPKRCNDGVRLPNAETQDCHDMTVHEAMKLFQIPIGIAAFVVTAIIASLIFLWYKNRVLRYKLYHRVAVTESYQAEELPQTQSCMAEDDEEDDEKVEFRKGENPGKKLFKKLREATRKEDDSLNLTKSFEVDLS